MYARLAKFEGDPTTFDDAITLVRERMAAGPPPELEGATFLMLVDRDTGTGYGLTVFATEEERARADKILNAEAGAGGTRVGVEFLEVPVHTLG